MIARTLTVGACLLLGLVLSACSFAPKYERPGQDIPAAWRAVDTGTEPLTLKWWERFNDPVLNAMVEEALRNNQDLAESLAKIASARAQQGQARSALFPMITGEAEAASNSTSERAANLTSYYDRNNPMRRTTTSYQGVIGGSWELDLWGKYRNQYTALTDMLLATSASHAGSRLLVAGQTAQGYFTLRALDMQLATARRTLKSREDSFVIYTSRYKQGDITELDWLRAKSEVETARAQVHTSTVGVDSAEAELAVLLGRSPREIMTSGMERGQKIENMPSPPLLPAGLPSELLNRRPDIRAAEYQLMAYNANIGAARANFFPSISLTGALGTMSSSVGWLFSGRAGMWNYGVQGSVPLLDFGRTWYEVKDAEAQKQGAIAIYNKTVQAAFQDIRTSLTKQREADFIVNSYKAQVDALSRALELARLQYDNGYTDYLTVLDAERQLFTVEMQLATALSDRLNAVVSVCMALGGGWEDPEIAKPVSDAAPSEAAAQ